MPVRSQCGHCKQLSPTYSKVADNLHGIVTIGAVDCEVDSNKPLCRQYGVQGFPTLKLFPAKRRKNSQTGRPNKSPEDYNGDLLARIGVAATVYRTVQYISRQCRLNGTILERTCLRASLLQPCSASGVYHAIASKYHPSQSEVLMCIKTFLHYSTTACIGCKPHTL